MLDKLVKVRNRVRSKKGFTLVELLVVVAIIAILVAIAIPVYSTQLEATRERVDAANVRTAESMAVTEYNVNPPKNANGETYYLKLIDVNKSTYQIDKNKKGPGYNLAKKSGTPKSSVVKVQINSDGSIKYSGWDKVS